MARTAGTGDDGLEAALRRSFGVFEQQVRRAMGRDDARLEGNAEILEDDRGRLHGRPVGIGTHDDSDDGLRVAHSPAFLSAASMVLASSMVMVIGPTPPGTGVICPATARQPAKSTSPHSLPSGRRL